MNYIVTSAQVRDYLELNSPGSTSKYSDETINSNIRYAQAYLEHITKRYLYDHPGVTWATTTMLRAQVPLPGFRTITSATWGGSTLSVATPLVSVANPSAWGLLESSPGVEDAYRLVVALQFRPWRVENDAPWWYADSRWWDKGLDNPYYPGNYGGGYAYTSMPNDLVIVGDGGYSPGNEPEVLKQVVKVLASFATMRPASILADMSITPAGGVLNYSDLPPEVRDYIADWSIGSQVESM